MDSQLEDFLNCDVFSEQESDDEKKEHAELKGDESVRECEGRSTPTNFNSSEPYVGKEFESLDDAEFFYRDYARKEGFDVRIKTRRKSLLTGQFCSCLFECKKRGKKSKDNVKDMVKEDCESEAKLSRRNRRKRDILVKTECGARMFVALQHDNIWRVTTFVAGHNHEMVSPSKINFIATYRHVTPVARQLIDVYNRANLGPTKMQHVFQTQAGGIGNVPFSRRDIENVVRDMRQQEGHPNDAQAAIDYLSKQQEESGGQFFFQARYTDDKRLTSLVWVDGRSRAAYKCFGDVVCFDTTYRTNRYDMPFAPFTGVNHHYHSILFGFALLCDEKEETFEWVLSTWLDAMEGCRPQTIITDQCQQIGDAVRNVLPQTHHSLCSWHISNKYPEKFNQIYKHHPTFSEEYNRCVNKSITTDEFDQRWLSMIVKYGLEDHEWLKSLYDVREQWIPAYTKRYFAAGMGTTSRSEAMNHYFDQFVSSSTRLLDFIKRSVEEALEKQFYRERKEDFDTKYYSRKLECNNPLEEHAATVYTRAMFKRFQVELRKSGQFTCNRFTMEGCNDNMKAYICKNVSGSGNRDRRMFTIICCKETGVLRCNCLLYEYLGILCRHILKYLTNKNATEIPVNYILKRWTVDGNKINGGSTTQYLQGKTKFDVGGVQTMRYNHLSQLFLGLAEDASCSREAYEYALGVVAREKQIIAKFESEIHKDVLREGCGDHGHNGQGPTDILDPKVVARKGRKREKRLKKPIEELHKVKSLRMCSLCKEFTDHDKRNHDKVMSKRQQTGSQQTV